MGDWFFFWGPNPFGSEWSVWQGLIFWGLVAFLVIGIPVYVFSKVLGKNHLLDRRLRNPQYAEKHKKDFFRIDQASGTVVLRSGIYPGQDKKWTLSGKSITVIPCGKHEKDETVRTVSFSQISRLEIEAPHKRRKFGDMACLRLWRNDGILSLELPEDELPDEALAFKPIGMEAALEIKRQFDEWAANKKRK